MKSGLIPRGDTVIRWVSPDGRHLEIHGPGARHVVMGEGPEGLSGVDVEYLFEAAARQHGETWTGYTMDHAEIDFPLHVLADSAEELRRKMDFVEVQFERFRPGWLMSYSVTSGWRWVRARRASMKALVNNDPGRRHEVTYEVVLSVEAPLSREADDSGYWINKAGSGRGELHLFPGMSEWHAWPQFILRGPGIFRLRWAGNDVTFPRLAADEWALVNTDESRQTIRCRNDRGIERNIWPEMSPGQRIPYPIRGGEVTRVDVSVVAGTRDSSVWAQVAVQHEGLV